MPSISRALAFTALLALVNSQAVILKAVGDKGESAPLQGTYSTLTLVLTAAIPEAY